LTTWIADTGNNRLLYEYYNGSKTVGSALGTGLSAPGGMAAECGSCGGNVFIADTGNNRIVKVGTQVADFGAVNVGSVTPAQTFFFAFTASTTLNAKTPFQTLTMGAAHLDFQNAGAGTCAAGGYAAGRACEVNVTFKPTLAGARAGAVVLDNSTGNAVATVYLHGTGQGPQIAYDPGVQTTLASGLSDPRGTAVDGSGNVYVADFGVDQIVKLIPAGVSSRFASVGSPESLAVDGAGNLYTTGTNSGGRSICLVSAGGAWVSCTFDSSEGTVGVAVDGWGYLYGADSVNQDVWYSGTSSGTISGGFTPEAVAVDSAGNLYIVDRDNWLVWEHTPAGNWSTVGSGYNRPQGVAVDQAGNVFVADMGNNQVVKVTPAGVQSTVGTGLSLPSAVAVDGTGNIYITDLGDGRLIKINRSTPPSLSFASTAVGKTSSDSPKEVTVENIGNAPLTFPVPSTGKNASLSTGFTLGTATTCPELSTSSSPATLAAGGACSYQVSFTPKVSGASIKGSLVLTDNNLNVAKATQTIALSGRATAAVVAVSWPAPVPIAAGTPLSSRQLDATASVPGKFVYSPAAGSKPAKGTVKLTTTFTPADTTRYKTATAAVNLVVK
jgi:sugar lactone lactonase YvrE